MDQSPPQDFPQEAAPRPRARLNAELINNTPLNREIFRLEFAWNGPAPRAGQFFMVRPRRGSSLLGRPISVGGWAPATEEGDAKKKAPGEKDPSARRLLNRPCSALLYLLIARRGRGTEELADLRPGEEAELTGPLGNAWVDVLPRAPKKRVALLGGGVGTAPLLALLMEEPPGFSFDFYAGFRNGFKTPEERYGLLGAALLGGARPLAAFEDPAAVLDSTDKRGRIPDFLDPAPYAAVCACGPEPMLKAVAAKCEAVGTPCFISLERRMACGVGACLGCAVRTTAGNKRCCADGPIFDARNIVF